MGKDTNEDDCTKRTVIINGENYYLVVGDKFVQVTVPRENDPARSETRQIAETLCDEITSVMELRAEVTEQPAA